MTTTHDRTVPLDSDSRSESDEGVSGPTPRSAGARIAVVLGVGFAVVAVAYGVLTLVALLTFRSGTTTSALPVPGGAVPRYVVDVAGEVRVEVAPPGTPPRMEVRRRWSWRAPEVRTSTGDSSTGETVRIAGSCGFSGPLPCSADVRLFVPAAADLQVHSSQGGVRVSGVRGQLQLSSDAGGVRAVDVAGPRLSMRSSAGGVRAERAAVSVVDASSSAGGVRLDLTVEPQSVVARSSAGSVRLAVPRGPATYRATADSSAGSRTVDVRTDPSSPRNLAVRSSAGAVTITYR